MLKHYEKTKNPFNRVPVNDGSVCDAEEVD